MLIVAGLLASCSQPPAQVVNKGHNVYAKTGTIQLVLVKEGQTLKSIARNHSITPEKLLNANGLKAGSEVLPGMSLIIPVSEDTEYQVATSELSEEINKTSLTPLEKNDDINKPVIGHMVSKEKTVKEVSDLSNEGKVVETQKSVTTETPASDKSKDHLNDDLDLTKDDQPAKVDHEADKKAPSSMARKFKLASPLGLNRFSWPVDGEVISGYGRAGNKFNDGINIAVPLGTSVQAADAGKVIYIGNNIEGYGNLVIIKHDGDFMSAYAHLKDIQIERGISVSKGDVLGSVGKTGNVSEPQLHYSMRQGKKTIDPEIALGK